MSFSKRSNTARRCRVTRILVWPNVSLKKDIMKDSYIDVILGQIRALNQVRDDLWFYLVLPEEKYAPLVQAVKALGNASYIPYPIPSHPPTMRVDFDTQAVLDFMGPQNLDFDLVYSHLPEHTFQLKSTIRNGTHYDPPFMGYSHWFDFKDVVVWNQPSFWEGITGLFEMEKVFVNTQAQRKKVIADASARYNAEAIAQLRRTLSPYYIGVDEASIAEFVAADYKPTIVFNHRPWDYKDFKGFMRIMDLLRKERQDFRVWIPLLDKPNRDWVDTHRFDTKELYLQELQRCCVGFAPMQKYEGWSIATVDGLKRGVPYVAYKAPYYQELCPEMLFYEKDEEAVQHFSRILDDKKERMRVAKKCHTFIKEHRLEKDSIKALSVAIDSTRETSRYVSDRSEAVPRIKELLKANYMTKAELCKTLKWGRHIQWTPYRNRLIHAEDAVCVDAMQHEPIYQLKQKRVRV